MKFSNFLSAATLLSISPFVLAEGQLTQLPIQALNSHWQLAAEQIQLPPEGQISSSRSTFAEISYLFDINRYFFAGLSSMASVTGGHGGFFIAGLNGGVHLPLGQYFFTEAGSFIGAGGGYASLVGGGLFLEPYADAGINIRGWQLAARYSYMSTPSQGKIHSSQVGVLLNIPSHFYMEGIPSNTLDSFFDFTKMFAAMGYMAYYSNQLAPQNIQQLAFELGYFFTPRFFGSLEPAGAFYTGTPQNGYMEIFANLGFRQPIANRFAFLAEGGLGAAGGGSAGTKDGGMARALLGVQAALNQHFAIELDGGGLRALSSGANAGVMSAKLDYFFNYPTRSQTANIVDSLDFIPWQLRIFNLSYFSPQHVTAPNPSNVQLLGLQFDLGLTDYWYGSAQTNIAYYGQSGGYATMMLGTGLRTKPFNQKGFAFGPELDIGAGGAGTMAVGDSLIIQPELNAYWGLTDHFSLLAGAGYLFTTKSSNMKTAILTAGLTWHFATASDN